MTLKQLCVGLHTSSHAHPMQEVLPQPRSDTSASLWGGQVPASLVDSMVFGARALIPQLLQAMASGCSQQVPLLKSSTASSRGHHHPALEGSYTHRGETTGRLLVSIQDNSEDSAPEHPGGFPNPQWPLDPSSSPPAAPTPTPSQVWFLRAPPQPTKNLLRGSLHFRVCFQEPDIKQSPNNLS